MPEDVVLDEIEAYARELSWVLHQIRVSLDGLTAVQLNWRPSTAANSAYAIASHVIGSTTVYALGFGCGQDVTRDRAAEFTASGTDASCLIVALRPGAPASPKVRDRRLAGRHAVLGRLRPRGRARGSTKGVSRRPLRPQFASGVSADLTRGSGAQGRSGLSTRAPQFLRSGVGSRDCSRLADPVRPSPDGDRRKPRHGDLRGARARRQRSRDRRAGARIRR